MPSGVKRPFNSHFQTHQNIIENIDSTEEEFFILKRPIAKFEEGGEIQPEITVSHKTSNKTNRQKSDFTPFEKQKGVKIIPFGTERLYQKQKQSSSGFTVFVATISVIMGLSLGIFLGFESPSETLAFFGVENAEVEYRIQTNDPSYQNWANSSIASLKNGSDDPDKDGLTNYQEYLLGSNPFNKYSCSNQSDLELVIDLRNPNGCKEIDFEDSKEINKFFEVFKSSNVINEQIKNFDPSINDDIPTGNIEPIKSQIDASVIEKYMLDSFSQKRNISSDNLPISAQDFIEISEKYSINISILLANSAPTEYGLRDVTSKINSEGNIEKTNNVTRLGSLNSPAYRFGNKKNSLITFALWYQYMKARSVPECKIVEILSNDIDECKNIQKHQEYIEKLLSNQDNE
jgi:hypothetical protein